MDEIKPLVLAIVLLLIAYQIAERFLRAAGIRLSRNMAPMRVVGRVLSLLISASRWLIAMVASLAFGVRRRRRIRRLPAGTLGPPRGQGPKSGRQRFGARW